MTDEPHNALEVRYETLMAHQADALCRAHALVCMRHLKRFQLPDAFRHGVKAVVWWLVRIETRRALKRLTKVST
jgi:hypothetical protein